MKTGFLIIIAILVSAILALNPFKFLSFNDASLFFTVIGVTYGVMSAFAINDTDKALDQLRDAFGKEVNSLKSIYLLSKSLSDNVAFKKICSSIVEYCKETIDLDLAAYGQGTKAHIKFHSLLSLISGIKIRGTRDRALFASILEDTKITSMSRDEQIILARDRLPKMQWILELFLSFILIGILTVVSVPQTIVSVAVVFFIMVAILFTLIVIYELDSMKDFEDEISNEPYRKLIAIVEHRI